MSSESEREKLIQAVLFEIEQIKSNPPSGVEIEEHMKLQDVVIKKFLAGASLSEVVLEGDRIGPEPGAVDIPDFEIMHFALRNLRLDEETCRELVEHERAHFDEATQLGFVPKIHITLLRDEHGKMQLKPSVSFDLPKQGDEELLRRHLRMILEAPIDLSPSDEERLK